jgi:hypothetical protein
MMAAEGRVLAVLVSATALAVANKPGQAVELRQPVTVAVVFDVAGRASITEKSGAAARLLRLHDWIHSGSTIQVGADSKLVLVFVSGKRFELGPLAKSTLTPDDLVRSAGPVHALPAFPRLPQVLPIAADERPSTNSAAVRIRGREISNLYPRTPATALTRSTVLRFEPVSDERRYLVEVEDESGARLFRAETATPAVSVPQGILEPGARYYWRVTSVNQAIPPARGEAAFRTVGREPEQELDALIAALEPAADAKTLALLAEIDRRLGLFMEARDRLRAALAKDPDNGSLRDALARVERLVPAGAGAQ